MKNLLSFTCLIAWLGFALCAQHVCAATVAKPMSRAEIILVVGAAGESEFGTNFFQQADLWDKTARQIGAKILQVGTSDSKNTNDYDRLKSVLANELTTGSNTLWLVLVGHGTFDGKEARFNLRGPDVTATELADWLKPIQRPILVIDTSSASAPFINKLSASNRVVISATRSGNEQNFARFGRFFSEAITQTQTDLDMDGQTSVLEAFLSASSAVVEFYKTEGRLMTEHALIDDNGDGLGTPADWFRGVRAIKKAQNAAVADGMRAHQMHLVLSPAEQALSPALRAKRDALERELFELREKKSQLPADDYYQQLESLCLEIARLQQSNANSNSLSIKK